MLAIDTAPSGLPLFYTPQFRNALTNDYLALFREIVLGDLEVERGGSLSYAAGDVVVGTVAGAEPAAEVAGFADGDASEMCTYTFFREKVTSARVSVGPQNALATDEC